jgi:hypothetical protein
VWSWAPALGAAASVVALALVLTGRRAPAQEVDAAALAVCAGVGLLAGVGWHRLAAVLPVRWIAVLVAVSTGGVWAGVPDTEAVVVVGGAWLPCTAAAIAWGGGRRATGPLLGWCALAVVLGWSVAWGTAARDEAIPGALACFGVALVAPWVAAWLRRDVDPRWLVPLHLAGTAVAARWATSTDSLGNGVVRAVGVLLATAAACAISLRLAAPARP